MAGWRQPRLLVVLGLLGVPPVLAQSGAAAEPASPAPQASPTPAPRRLSLGLFALPAGAPSAQTLIDAPRFESSIDVNATAPPDLNETMAIWWRHWQISTGSIYGRNIPFTNQGCPTCVNVLPLFDWVAQKWKNRGHGETMPEPEASPEAPPE